LSLLRSKLPHSNFIAAVLKVNFIHQLTDQVNPATVIRIHVFTLLRIGQAFRTESRSGVSDDDCDSTLQIALQAALNFFRRIVITSVHDGISQGLLDREPDFQLLFFWDIERTNKSEIAFVMAIIEAVSAGMRRFSNSESSSLRDRALGSLCMKAHLPC
jgi:hypothetical protein